MKCPNCEAQWQLPKGRTVTACPFCGQSLLPEKRELATLEDMLREVIRLFGIEQLKDSARTLALLADLAPDLRREWRLLQCLSRYGDDQVLLALRLEDGQAQAAGYRRTVTKLVDEQFLDRAVAEEACSAYLLAIDVTPPLPQQPPAEPPKPQSASPRTPHRSAVSSVNDLLTVLSAAAHKSVPVSSTQTATPPKPAPTPTSTPRTQPKTQPKPPVKPASPQAQSTGVIRTYKQYLKELEAWFLRTGRRVKTKQEITDFIRGFRLDKAFGIQVSHVEQDLLDVYIRFGVTVPTPDQVNSYSQYKAALLAAYVENGRRMLSQAQVLRFLEKYDLTRRFGITPQDVTTDLTALAANRLQ